MGAAAVPEMGKLAFRVHERALREWLSRFLNREGTSPDSVRVVVLGSLVGGTGSSVMPLMGGLVQDLIRPSGTRGWVVGIAVESYAFAAMVPPDLQHHLRQNQKRSMSWLSQELSQLDGKSGYNAFYTVSAPDEVNWQDAHQRLAERIVNSWERSRSEVDSPIMFEGHESILISVGSQHEPKFTVLWGPGSSLLRPGGISTAHELGVFFQVPHLPRTWTEPIEAFRSLLRNSEVREVDIQQFLERHPFFLTGVDYKRAVPQVHLEVHDARGLIPDFMLVPFDSDFADIVQLKHPNRNLLADNENHPRFSAAVTAGLAQLRDYESYFDEEANRQRLRDKFGFTAFKPKLSLIIGQASAVPSTFIFRKVCADSARVTIYTYDQIIARAERLLKLRLA